MLTLQRLFRTALPLAFVLAFSPGAAHAKSKKTQTVECKDGTTSKPGRGACSHHGGVAATTSDTKREEVDQPEAARSKTKSSSSSGSEARAAPRLDRAPAAEPAPSTGQMAATVQCKDGTTSKAGRGACSHHGGVASAANDTAREPVEQPAAAPRELPSSNSPPQGREGPRPERAPATERTPSTGQPTARCKDGSFSYAKQHSGACSHHGGVAEWLQ